MSHSYPSVSREQFTRSARLPDRTKPRTVATS